MKKIITILLILFNTLFVYSLNIHLKESVALFMILCLLEFLSTSLYFMIKDEYSKLK